MDKYTLLELTILEERIEARIPPIPELTADHRLGHADPAFIEAHEYDNKKFEKWERDYEKEQNALNKIKVEISKRLDEVIKSE